MFTIDALNGTFRILAQGVTMIGQAASPFVAQTPGVLSTSYAADNSWAMHMNGVANGAGTTAATFNDVKLALGGNVPNTLYDGLMGEAMIYNRVLSTVERQQVEAYLKTKWGTP
jgi:hypothetical protein